MLLLWELGEEEVQPRAGVKGTVVASLGDASAVYHCSLRVGESRRGMQVTVAACVRGAVRLFDGLTASAIGDIKLPGGDPQWCGLCRTHGALACVYTWREQSAVGLWDVDTGERIAEFKGGEEMTTGAWTGNGALIAAGTRTGVVKLWDLSGVLAASKASRFTDGAMRGVQEPTKQLSQVSLSRCAPCVLGTTMLSLLYIPPGVCHAPLQVAPALTHVAIRGHCARIQCVSVAPDGSKIASCSEDGVVLLVRPWRDNLCMGDME